MDFFHLVCIMGVASIRFCPDILCHLEFLPDGALVNNRRGRPRISIQNHRPAVLISQRNIDQITAFRRHGRSGAGVDMLRRVLARKLTIHLADPVVNFKIQDSIFRNLLLLYMDYITAVCGVVGNLRSGKLLLLLFLYRHRLFHPFIAGNIPLGGSGSVLI